MSLRSSNWGPAAEAFILESLSAPPPRKAARNLNLAGFRERAIQVGAADEFTPECAAGNPGNSGGRDHKLCANRRPNNGPVYARDSCDNLGQDIRSLCTSSNTSAGSQGAATTSFRLRQMESGRTARSTSGRPYGWRQSWSTEPIGKLRLSAETS